MWRLLKGRDDENDEYSIRHLKVSGPKLLNNLIVTIVVVHFWWKYNLPKISSNEKLPLKEHGNSTLKPQNLHDHVAIYLCLFKKHFCHINIFTEINGLISLANNILPQHFFLFVT